MEDYTIFRRAPISENMDMRDAMKKRQSLFLLKDLEGHLLQGRMIFYGSVPSKYS
jgi:hypothetical protein